jgi:hypothetical protein
MPETFNGNYRQNTLQFLMQLVNEKEQAAPTPAPSEDTQEEVNP